MHRSRRHRKPVFVPDLICARMLIIVRGEDYDGTSALPLGTRVRLDHNLDIMIQGHQEIESTLPKNLLNQGKLTMTPSSRVLLFE